MISIGYMIETMNIRFHTKHHKKRMIADVTENFLDPLEWDRDEIAQNAPIAM